MKLKRLHLAGLLLVIIGAGTVAICFRPTPEPSYNGKRLGVWFKEYTGRAGQSLLAPSGAGARYVYFSTNYPSWITAQNRASFSVVSNRGGWFVLTNRSISLPAPSPAPTNDAWTAIRAIGSNAAPYLAAQMHRSRWERYYERNFTNLPAFLQKKLPHPAQKWFARQRAIEIAERLGPAAHETAPALLELLYEGDSRSQRTVVPALLSVRADRVKVTAALVRLETEKRYPEILQIVPKLGWKDRETARLLGRILAGPDPTVHREAMRLLEAGGACAAPAAEPIIAALKHQDPEVRYLAARALEQIAKTVPPDEKPELEQRLRALLADKSVIVRNVSRRVLTKLGVSNLPAPLED